MCSKRLTALGDFSRLSTLLKVFLSTIDSEALKFFLQKNETNLASTKDSGEISERPVNAEMCSFQVISPCGGMERNDFSDQVRACMLTPNNVALAKRTTLKYRYTRYSKISYSSPCSEI